MECEIPTSHSSKISCWITNPDHVLHTTPGRCPAAAVLPRFGKRSSATSTGIWDRMRHTCHWAFLFHSQTSTRYEYFSLEMPPGTAHSVLAEILIRFQRLCKTSDPALRLLHSVEWQVEKTSWRNNKRLANPKMRVTCSAEQRCATSRIAKIISSALQANNCMFVRLCWFIEPRSADLAKMP